jgi:hypothetical protein
MPPRCGFTHIPSGWVRFMPPRCGFTHFPSGWVRFLRTHGLLRHYLTFYFLLLTCAAASRISVIVFFAGERDFL